MEDPLEKNWQVVIKNAPCDLSNMPEKYSEVKMVHCGQNEPYNIREDEKVTWDNSVITPTQKNRRLVLYFTYGLINLLIKRSVLHSVILIMSI